MSNDATETKLLEDSIERVWNERDDTRRLSAIAELYDASARILEPERSIEGHEAISAVVAGVLADMPPAFRFEVTWSPASHLGVAMARWQGTASGQILPSGGDVARVRDGKIAEHFFFFDAQQ